MISETPWKRSINGKQRSLFSTQDMVESVFLYKEERTISGKLLEKPACTNTGRRQRTLNNSKTNAVFHGMNRKTGAVYQEEEAAQADAV
jgi:hypothetical protein